MKVGLWAEIRRLKEIEKLSHRAIARRLRCCAKTVKKALALERPPDRLVRPPRASLLDPYKPQIDALVARTAELSAARVLEEIQRGEQGYRGGVKLVRKYLQQIRAPRGRIYQEVDWQPGEAMQVDWGACGRIRLGNTTRRVSVFVAVLCFSRLCYIEFCLAERKADFYRALVHALEFFGGIPRKLILDNLKAAVLNGSGRAACLHPEFLALCGHYYLEAVPCPSEHLALKLGHVDWERGRITITSPKTEHHEGKESRIIPLFPELRQLLEQAFDEAPEGAEHFIRRYRDTNSNLRTQLKRIIRKAGLEPWPKLFQNLRASRETELAEEHPAHIVAAWMGHSVSVSAKHYLQVRDSDFDKAVQNPVHLGRKSGAVSRGEAVHENQENPVFSRVSATPKVAGAGLEPARE